MKKIKFFTEFKKERNSMNVPPAIFFKKGYCEEVDEQIVFKTVGFLIGNDEVYVIFPKGVFKRESIQENIVLAQLLFQTLKKYNKSVMKSHVNYGDNTERSSFMSIISWIVDDYSRNGIIQTVLKKKETNGKSKINWSKTIKETTPYLINERILYLDTINITTLNNLNNEVSLVHYIILKEIQKEFGWILNFKVSEDVVNSNHNITYDRMKYVIKMALRNTFNQNTITLYKMLISYIDKIKIANRKNDFSLVYTQYFQYIWETMCKSLFKDDQKLHKLLPKPYWNVGQKEKQTEQIPDTLTTDSSKNLYIIDAKYYRPYDGLGNLPGWKDIVKQLFYAKSIEMKKFNSISNIFIMPSPLGNPQKPLIDHGFAAVKGREEEFGKVISFELNIIWAMDTYVNSNNPNVKDMLIDYININSKGN